MGYTVHYTGPRAKRKAKALQDALTWLDGFNADWRAKIEQTFIEAFAQGATKREMRFSVAFAGIQGFPATIWLGHIRQKAMPQG